MLINYNANATKAEPATGMSALTVAFSQSNEPMATLLLHYGASPDIEDGKGATARSLAKKPHMQALIDRWDKHGTMAFEVSDPSPTNARPLAVHQHRAGS